MQLSFIDCLEYAICARWLVWWECKGSNSEWSLASHHTYLWSTNVILPSTVIREMNSLELLPIISEQFGALVTCNRPMATKQQWLPSSSLPRSICTPRNKMRFRFLVM